MNSAARAKAGRNYIPAILLCYFGVREDLKRRGFGAETMRRVFTRCLEISRNCGAAYVVLDVEIDNTDAIGFYDGAKFKDFPARKVDPAKADPAKAEPAKAEPADAPKAKGPVLKKMWINMAQVGESLGMLK